MSLEQCLHRPATAVLSESDQVGMDNATVMTAGHSDFTDSQNQQRNTRLAQWFQEWRPAMRRWLSSRSSIQSADLDDVAQEVFLRLLRYSDGTPVQYPQSYLFRIAVNVVNEWGERSRNKLPHAEAGLEDLLIEPCDEPENSVERTLVDQHVQTAVDRLPKRCRDVLILHIHEDLTYKQIAIKLQLTPRIVRRDIARAYAELRSDLGSVALDKFTKLMRGSSGRHPVKQDACSAPRRTLA